jgi:hypothetical protein
MIAFCSFLLAYPDKILATGWIQPVSGFARFSQPDPAQNARVKTLRVRINIGNGRRHLSRYRNHPCVKSQFGSSGFGNFPRRDNNASNKK